MVVLSIDVNLPKDSQHEFKYLVDQEKLVKLILVQPDIQNVFGTTNSVLSI